MWLQNAVSDQLGHLKLESVGEQRLQRESCSFPNVTTHVASFVPIRRVCPHHWLEIGGMLKVRWPDLLLRSVWPKQSRTHWQQWQEFADCWGSNSSHHDTGTLDSSGRPYFKVSLNHFSAACQLDSYIPWWIIFFPDNTLSGCCCLQPRVSDSTELWKNRERILFWQGWQKLPITLPPLYSSHSDTHFLCKQEMKALFIYVKRKLWVINLSILFNTDIYIAFRKRSPSEHNTYILFYCLF